MPDVPTLYVMELSTWLFFAGDETPAAVVAGATAAGFEAEDDPQPPDDFVTDGAAAGADWPADGAVAGATAGAGAGATAGFEAEDDPQPPDDCVTDLAGAGAGAGFAGAGAGAGFGVDLEDDPQPPEDLEDELLNEPLDVLASAVTTGIASRAANATTLNLRNNPNFLFIVVSL